MLINLDEIKTGNNKSTKNMALMLAGFSILASSLATKTNQGSHLMSANADTVVQPQQQKQNQNELSAQQQKQNQGGLSAQARQEIKDKYNFDAVSAKLNSDQSLTLTAQDGSQLTISKPQLTNDIQDVTAQTGNDSPDKWGNLNTNDNQQNGNQQTQGITDKNVNFNLPSDLSGVRQKIVDLAKSQLGVPYVWGGTSWGKGMDCSGFVQQVYKQVGINLPRVSQAQSSCLKVIPLSQAKAGDLVFWGGQGTAYHIAIYIGNNQVIEEPEPGESCHIVHLYGNYQIGTLDGINH